MTSTVPTAPKSAFARFQAKAWPHRFTGTLLVGCMAGGTPTDPRVAESWIRKNLGVTTEELLQKQVAEVMVERGVTTDGDDDIVAQVNANKHLNGFKRGRCANCPKTGLFCADGEHPLFLEGRCLKAAIKEATSVAVATGKIAPQGWGRTNKWIKGFTAEHICVVEDKLYLYAAGEDGVLAPVTKPSGVNQRFVSTHNGTGIQYEEYVNNAQVRFTVITDYDFTDEHWAMMWLTGEQQGLGATRSQGYGRYTVTEWKREA